MRAARLAAVIVVLFALATPATANPVTRMASQPAGDGECALINDSGIDPTPVGVSQCRGVRPGAAVNTALGGCTFGFAFVGTYIGGDGQPRYRRLIATAGHCVIEGEGERTWAPGSGPPVRAGRDHVVGGAVYARVDAAHDFALIELLDGVEVNPQVCQFGGPTGLDSGQRAGPEVVQHYGNGLGYGVVVPARSGVARDLSDPVNLYFDGLTSFGDSGGPVTGSDGKALGMLKSIRVQANGVVRAMRLQPQMDAAAAALGLGLTLQLAPELEPPAP